MIFLILFFNSIYLLNTTMPKLYNFHTHSYFCDGSDHPEKYVLAALAADFHSLGFSSHAPVPFQNNFAIQDKEQLETYCNIIRDLKNKYSERINIYLALETDYIKGISTDFSDVKKTNKLDYVIGSVHLVRNGSDRGLWFIDGPKAESYDKGLQEVFGGDVKKAVKAYYDQVIQMLLAQKPDIVGHLDKIKMHNKDRYFKENESWYQDLLMRTLEIIGQCDCVVEVNTRGVYKKRSPDLFPGIWVLKEIRKMGIPITLSSDAHRPEEINGYYSEAVEILKDCGFKSTYYFTLDGWKEQAL